MRHCLPGVDVGTLHMNSWGRAMTTLTMSHCAGRKKYGQLLPCHPSQFLKEFPPELIEVETEKNAKPVSQAAGKDLFAALRNAVR